MPTRSTSEHPDKPLLLLVKAITEKNNNNSKKCSP
jgi:hypothetical protein